MSTLPLEKLSESNPSSSHCGCHDLSYELSYDHELDAIRSQSFFKFIGRLGGLVVIGGNLDFKPLEQRQLKLYVLYVS